MNRDDLIKQFRVKTEKADILGAEVLLREMSGRDRDEYFVKLAKAEQITTVIEGEEKSFPNVAGVKSYLIARLIVNDDLTPSYCEDEIDTMSAEFIDAIFEKIMAMNKLTDKEIKETEKN
jgi:hypothetical protein